VLPLATIPLAILSVSSENQSYLLNHVAPITRPRAEVPKFQLQNPGRRRPTLNPMTILRILSKCEIPVQKTQNFTRRSQLPDPEPWTTRSIQPQHSLLWICVLLKCGKSTLMLPCRLVRTPDIAAKSPIRRKVLVQKRDHLRFCPSSRRRSQTRLNLGSRFPRPEGVLDQIPNVMTSRSISKTWLLSICQAIYNGLFVRVSLSRIFPRLLNWASTLTSIIVAIIFISALVVFFSPLIWLVVWAWDIPVNAIDHWTKDICYWSWLSPICSYGCSISPWFVLYMFSDTCSYGTSRKGPLVKPSWQTANASDKIDSIPRLIDVHEFKCRFYSEGLPIIRDGLPILEDAKETLQLTQNEICSGLKDSSIYLPPFYRHLDLSSKALLRHVDSRQAWFKDVWASIFSKSITVQQEKLNEELPDIVTQWQKKYEDLVTPGQQVMKKVQASREKLGAHLSILEDLKQQTSRARIDEISSWSLLRRIMRSAGLLGLEAPELYGSDNALESLDGWIAETTFVVKLYTGIDYQVAKAHNSLLDVAASKFAADVHAQLGPDALLDLHSYWTEMGSKAQEVRESVDGA